MRCFKCCDKNGGTESSTWSTASQKRRRNVPGASSGDRLPQRPLRSSGAPVTTREAAPREEGQPQAAPPIVPFGLQGRRSDRGGERSTSTEERQKASGSSGIVSANHSGTVDTKRGMQIAKRAVPATVPSSNSVTAAESLTSPQNTRKTCGSSIVNQPSRPADALKSSSQRGRQLESVEQQSVVLHRPASPFAIYNQQFPPTGSPRSNRGVIAVPTGSSQSPAASLTRQQAIDLGEVSSVMREASQELRGASETPIRKLARASPNHLSGTSAGSSARPPRSPSVSAGLSTRQGPKSDLSTESSTRPRLRTELSAQLVASHPTGPPTTAGAPNIPQVPLRRMLLGIESEIYLSAHNANYRVTELETFVKTLAENYNNELPCTYRRMQTRIARHEKDLSFSRWAMAEEQYMGDAPEGVNPPCGMELVSPIFENHPNSTWRNEVTATWRFLQRHYLIETNDVCATHIHVSIEPAYELSDLQRIACAVIHFETAIEALVPPERRRNAFAKSNWLASPLLAQKGLSRSESMALIERGRWDDEALKPVQEFGVRDYAWNFESLGKYGTIEFRKPPPSTTPEEALSWAEFALNFIQAAVMYGTSHRLQKVPATVGGLRWFLRQAELPGLNEPNRLQMIWAGQDMNSAMEPEYEPRKGSTVDLQADATIKRMALEDIKRIRIHAKSVKEPYW